MILTVLSDRIQGWHLVDCKSWVNYMLSAKWGIKPREGVPDCRAQILVFIKQDDSRACQSVQ